MPPAAGQTSATGCPTDFLSTASASDVVTEPLSLTSPHSYSAAEVLLARLSAALISKTAVVHFVIVIPRRGVLQRARERPAERRARSLFANGDSRPRGNLAEKSRS